MKDTFFKGFFGATTSFGGAVFSMLPQVEQWLRITSLLVGITVGVLTGISLVRNIKKKE